MVEVKVDSTLMIIIDQTHCPADHVLIVISNCRVSWLRNMALLPPLLLLHLLTAGEQISACWRSPSTHFGVISFLPLFPISPVSGVG
jgi:hypothetical protein